MNRKQLLQTVVVSVWCALALVAPCAADNGQPQAKKVVTILDYKKDLGLSESQSNIIRQAMAKFRGELAESMAGLEAAQAEFNKAMEARKATEEIKPLLSTIYNFRFQIHYLDVVTARSVEDALTAQQMNQWHQIQARARPTQKN